MANLVHRRRSRTERRLIEQCESFLGGRLVESLARAGDPVPAWALTNLLAHGSEQDLEAEARGVGWRGSRRSGCLLAEWRYARSYLCGQVLATARACGSLSDLQQVTLVPLELELAGSAGMAAEGPQHWVAGVMQALDEHRRRVDAS